ncbi:unnamed protein product [Parascedosporium putredinis]|uniref:Uncharacterized protein n=1 Tax=Parascedosporium putredinis TaxID=1442378 RepID=A0A9P1HCY2_9PEZI|nr:unnamed protein product [Parascedosporium putredinis]CAI8003472.1 unnamed protein product [Parascedosporium putredinis]
MRAPSGYDLDELEPRPTDGLLATETPELTRRRKPRIEPRQRTTEIPPDVRSEEEFFAHTQPLFTGPPPPIARSVWMKGQGRHGRAKSPANSTLPPSKQIATSLLNLGSVLFDNRERHSELLTHPASDSVWHNLRRREKAVEKDLQHALDMQTDALLGELEERLIGLRNKKRWVDDRIDDVQNRREAGLSGYKGALREMQSDVASLMSHPPVAPSTESFGLYVISRKETNKACMVLEDTTAQTKGKGKGKMPNHQDMANQILSQMAPVITGLDTRLREAEGKQWNLLICAIGAELDTFREAEKVLQVSTRSAAKDTLIDQAPHESDADVSSVRTESPVFKPSLATLDTTIGRKATMTFRRIYSLRPQKRNTTPRERGRPVLNSPRRSIAATARIQSRKSI